MEHLWAPWRMEYILDDRGGACIFCAKPSRREDRKRLILLRSESSLVMMNRFPYNSGHLMVAPLKHIGDLEDLTPQELLDLSTLVKKAVTLLRGAINPQGFNIGMNMGSIAGAGITDHLHVHVVPRWSGDTNFMPVVGKTKVLPESLANTYEKLSSALKALSRD